VMIAGGFDNISEEGSYQFANMKETSNTETEFAMGHEPTENGSSCNNISCWGNLRCMVIKRKLFYFILFMESQVCGS
jgi:hypothetical protein